MRRFVCAAAVVFCFSAACGPEDAVVGWTGDALEATGPETPWASVAAEGGFLAVVEEVATPAGGRYLSARFSGDVLIGGHRFHHDATEEDPSDVLVVRLDAAGTPMWARQMTQGDLIQLGVTPTGGVLVGGTDLLIELSSVGVERRRTILAETIEPPLPGADPHRFVVTDLVVNDLGDTLLAGHLRWYAFAGEPASLDELGPGFVLKLDDEGQRLWVQQMRRARPRALATDGHGGVFVAAVFYDGGVELNDETRLRHESGMFFARLRDDGALDWVRDAGPVTPLALSASNDGADHFVAAGAFTEPFSLAGREFSPPLPGAIGLFRVVFGPDGELADGVVAQQNP